MACSVHRITLEGKECLRSAAESARVAGMICPVASVTHRHAPALRPAAGGMANNRVNINNATRWRAHA
jgi:hypothetical protein